MKLSVIILLGMSLSACSLWQEPISQETYFVPVIRSDVSNSGYTPSVIPIVRKSNKELPLSYPSTVN
ncbi:MULTISPECIES: hypothetical protein [Marinomonas]|uniref:hypothetical protein n=1 Tax=Marinomonas TaxID=28253 RepID=UPI0010565F6B|nr:hypothetical protein [Marinomonas flavescens]